MELERMGPAHDAGQLLGLCDQYMYRNLWVGTAENDEPHCTMRHELAAVLGLPFADIRDTGVQLGL
eukprot:1193852-Prymnesium_polylepis.1